MPLNSDNRPGCWLLSFHASGSAGRWPTLGVTEDVLPG